MVPAGTVLTFSVRGATTTEWLTLFNTPAELQGEVQNELAKHFDQSDVVVTPEDTILTGMLPWRYRATVRVKTRYAHAQPEDAGTFVRTAFVKAAGAAPSVALVAEGSAAGTFPELPRPPGLPSFTWPTALVIVGAAVIVLAWKF